VQKTPIVGALGSVICSVLSFYTVLMVPSSMFITTIGGGRSPSDIFTLGETIHFESVEFITNQFGGLSPSPLEDGSGTIITDPAHGEPLLLQQTMIGGPIVGSP
jgi:hypothetical protein